LQASFVLLLLGMSACQRRPGAVPVPPAPATSQPAQQQPTAPAASNSAAPNSQPATQPEAPGSYQVNKPAPAAKKPARPAASPAPVPASSATPTPAAPPPPPAPTPAPKLGDVLTADERKQLGSAIDQSLANAQASIDHIRGRQLTAAQAEDLEQIRNFVKQAQTTRESDPGGAKSLAERAEVLARDLAAMFR
jgi:hypothetical protein